MRRSARLAEDPALPLRRMARRAISWRAPVRALLAALACLLSSQARAQLLDRYFPANVPAFQDWEQATSGPPLDLGYAPLGEKVGRFFVYPSLDETLGYATNPYGTPRGPSSGYATTNAAVAINSDWTRNSVNAYVDVSNTQYFATGQSLTDWTAAAGGMVMVGNDQLQLGYAHVYTVNLPTSFGSFALLSPVTEQDDELRASYTWGSGRISLVPALQGDLFRFGSFGSAESAGTEGLFDRDAVTASLTANWEFGGGHNVVLILSDSSVGYQGNAPGRPAPYDDLSVLAGVEYRQSAVLAYRLLAGYEDRMPSGHGTTDQTLAAPAAELDVLWNPTALTSVVAKLSQSFQDSPTDGGQGIDETSLQLSLSHALSRAVQLSASARYVQGNFPDDEGSEQGVFTTLQADWHLSRRIVITGQYQFSDQSGSNLASLSYRDHQISLRGRLQW